MQNTKILVAEDDANIRRGLVDALASELYQVEEAADGEEALKSWRANHPDLVILDLMMPKISGYDVCRAIRRIDQAIPILMLTAKGEEIDKVVGFELGADDYVTKPFGVRELLARIAALLKRARRNGNGNSEGTTLPDSFHFGLALVDRKQYVVTLEGVTKPLTSRELKLLELFYSRPDEVLTRDFLLNEVWGIKYYGTTRTLDQHILQIRKKVEPFRESSVIVTIHGAGYKYNRKICG